MLRDLCSEQQHQRNHHINRQQTTEAIRQSSAWCVGILRYFANPSTRKTTTTTRTTTTTITCNVTECERFLFVSKVSPPSIPSYPRSVRTSPAVRANVHDTSTENVLACTPGRDVLRGERPSALLWGEAGGRRGRAALAIQARSTRSRGDQAREPSDRHVDELLEDVLVRLVSELHGRHCSVKQKLLVFLSCVRVCGVSVCVVLVVLFSFFVVWNACYPILVSFVCAVASVILFFLWLIRWCHFSAIRWFTFRYCFFGHIF